MDRLIELVPEAQEQLDKFYKDKEAESRADKIKFAIASVAVHPAFDLLDFVEHYFETTDKPCLVVKEIHGKLKQYSDSTARPMRLDTGLWHIHGSWKEDIPDKHDRARVGWTNIMYEHFPHPLREGAGSKKTRPIRIAFPEKEIEKEFFPMLARLPAVDPSGLPSWRRLSTFSVVHSLVSFRWKNPDFRIEES